MAAFFIIFGIICLLLLMDGAGNLNSESDDSIANHHAYGCYRVQYPDGLLSQPFHYETAKSYAKIFGGKVIPK